MTITLSVDGLDPITARSIMIMITDITYYLSVNV